VLLATLEGAFFSPLWIMAIAYGALFVLAQVAGARGATDLRERLLDFGFVVGLLAAAWVVVLLLTAIVSESDLVYDMVVILLVVVAFFALLLFALFAIFELIFSRGRRRAPVPTQEPEGSAPASD
jgi:hypothetical protein